VNPDTVTEVCPSFEKLGEFTIKVRWYDNDPLYCHRNSDQVFYRNEKAPGDNAPVTVVFSETYNDYVPPPLAANASPGGALQTPSPSPQKGLGGAVQALSHSPKKGLRGVVGGVGDGEADDDLEHAYTELAKTQAKLAQVKSDLAVSVAKIAQLEKQSQASSGNIPIEPMILGVQSRNG